MASDQLNVTVAVRFAVKASVQGFVLLGESQPNQLPNDDPELGVAVSVMELPLTN